MLARATEPFSRSSSFKFSMDSSAGNMLKIEPERDLERRAWSPVPSAEGVDTFERMLLSVAAAILTNRCSSGVTMLNLRLEGNSLRGKWGKLLRWKILARSGSTVSRQLPPKLGGLECVTVELLHGCVRDWQSA